jgi:hypothetical protein
MRAYDPHHGTPPEQQAHWSVSRASTDAERRACLVGGVIWMVIQRAWCERAQRRAWSYYLTTTRGDILYQSHDPHETAALASDAASRHVINMSRDMIEDAQGVLT